MRSIVISVYYMLQNKGMKTITLPDATEITILNILILFFSLVSLTAISVIRETTNTKDVTKPSTSKTRTPIIHAERKNL